MAYFDKHPVLYPFPEILRQTGFCFTYKPREVWWKHWLLKLKLKPGEKVLDVGCGDGVFLDRLSADYQIKGFGVDASKKSILRAKENSIYHSHLQLARAEKLPFKNNFFDVLTSFDVLEHIKNQNKALSEMVRVLKPKGRILIYTINKKQKWTWDWLLNKFWPYVYKRADHDPKLLLEPKQLNLELNQKGIEVKKLAYFNSFFTLVIDETIMIFIYILTKIGLNKGKRHCLGRIILVFLTGFSKAVTPLLNFLDTPWRKKGHSNGFLVLGEKRED